MVDISTTQNQPQNIQRLAAQRYLYSRAKRLLTIQVLLAGTTPLAGSIAIALCAGAQSWVVLMGILATLLDRFYLDPGQCRFREMAATIQEDFDCIVLSLSWNKVLAGRRPAAEDIYEAAQKDKQVPEALLENWYPTIIGSLPLHLARLICQRTNCWWGSKLRCQYRTYIVIALVFISLFVVTLGFLTGMNLQKLVLAVLAPLLPALLWGICEARRQKQAATALDGLKDCAECFWQDVVQGKLTEPETTTRSRELQNAILLHRRTNPFVLDWVYRKLRRNYEDQMRVGAEQMVAQIKTSSGGF